MGQDEVTLKDGGTVRGTVVSSQPGVGVKIIELGETEAHMIPWAQVGDVERGKFAPKKKKGAQPGSAGPGYAEPPPPPAGVPVPVPVAPAAGNQVRLHITSPQPATVFSHQTAYGAVNGYGFVIDAAHPVCSSPCDQVFDSNSGQTYTVGGEFNPSSAFSLAGQHGDVELSVEPGSRGIRRLGSGLIVTGGVLIAAGVAIALTGVLIDSETTYNADGTTSQNTGGTSLVPVGVGIAVGGVAAIVGGIVAIVESKTKTDLHPMGAAASGATAVAPRYWMGEF
jgi:hypothetical protein